jgi:transposase-like protein
MEKYNILNQIPKEHQIKRELRHALFGKKLFCPHCGSPQVKKYDNRYRCKQCRKPFSLTLVSWLKGMKLPLQTFWLVLWCWTNKIPIDQAQKACSLSELTVRRWYKKFREHLPCIPFIKSSHISDKLAFKKTKSETLNSLRCNLRCFWDEVQTAVKKTHQFSLFVKS